ncbi:mitotic checkpoint serine/threonine-protein kinase BUB1 beta-like [Myxocyprinus asiaticus]|uniref:mitotic checkpoint serine/threonine-protein kinase BUB1 beta-like n=1 Tax=Myxocyprinus asiaticus TaxID=70543 RepID=UPI002223E7A7|nr:mitotic checkpoint serine/threonine-protein kinase BUB1 beta-like [Myxocyprinus asiaticus]
MAECEFSGNNNILLPQKMEELAPPEMKSIPGNHAETVHSLQTQGEPPVLMEGQLQIMYSKEQVYQVEEEFSFEELRAQRYYKALREKAAHLKKMKQDLQLQIEQKQRLILQRNSTAPLQIIGEEAESKDMCESVVTMVKSAPFKIYSEQEVGLMYTSKSSVNQDEDTSKGGSDAKLHKTATSKPFTIFDENTQPNEILRASTTNRKSFKLPTLNLKAQRSNAELYTDKDASISHSEEAIINGHWNKTLCRSPNDTCEFAHAAQFASTPFGGVERQKQPKAALKESQTAPETTKASNTDSAVDTKKLSPILEISHECGATSFVAFSHEPMKRSDDSDVTRAVERSESMPENAVVKCVDVCSAEVRIRLLQQTDMTSFSNFHRETGLMPTACGDDDLNLGGEMLFYRSKLGKLTDYTLYTSSTGIVVVKVDYSAVPWDFYISSKLRARHSSDAHDSSDVQISCYFYENGCITLWRVPHGDTVQDLLAKPITHRYKMPLLIIQLLEMMKHFHSCHVIHGGLKPKTLYLYGSGFLALDFSHSVDLELQTEVKTAQDLPSSQIYIEQGLLLPAASPYQVDLISVAEIVHMLLFNRPMKVLRRNSCWSLDEDSESHHSPVEPVWKEFFHIILNPGNTSTELVLSDLLIYTRNSL